MTISEKSKFIETHTDLLHFVASEVKRELTLANHEELFAAAAVGLINGLDQHPENEQYLIACAKSEALTCDKKITQCQ